MIYIIDLIAVAHPTWTAGGSLSSAVFTFTFREAAVKSDFRLEKPQLCLRCCPAGCSLAEVMIFGDDPREFILRSLSYIPFSTADLSHCYNTNSPDISPSILLPWLIHSPTATPVLPCYHRGSFRLAVREHPRQPSDGEVFP
jgi:hypothetical protein